MRSTFVRQMALTVALILLTVAFLGSAFQMTITSYLESEKTGTLADNAHSIAALSRAYGSAEALESSWDFAMTMHLASRVSGADAVVCDLQGRVLVCTCDRFSCEHIGRYLEAGPVRTALINGELSAKGDLGLYQEERFYHALRLSAADERVFGVIVVSSPTADVSSRVARMLRIFLFTALVAMVIAVVATWFVSRHMARPVRELTDVVRRFGHGELSARAKCRRSDSAEVEALAAAFNNMADTLEQTDRRRQEFVANVSHELKTPMTTIGGYMEGMLDGTIPQEQHPKYMRMVSDEVRRLSRMVRSMLDLSRMQADGLDESKKTRFDLGEAVTQVLLSFEQKIEQRRLEVDLHLPEKPLYTVAVQDAVTQVVYNLVDNAVKFCSDCGYLRVHVRQEGAKALVTVENTGACIPPEELPLIFDRFHKLDRSRSKDRDGVGLGLYIVKTIVGAHGEDIWVESRDGRTAFTFTMPAVKSTNSERGSAHGTEKA